MQAKDVIDFVVGINFATLFVIRYQYLFRDLADENLEKDVNLSVAFDTIFALNTILIYVRVTSAFAMSKNFGPLLVMIQKMFTDVRVK